MYQYPPLEQQRSEDDAHNMRNDLRNTERELSLAYTERDARMVEFAEMENELRVVRAERDAAFDRIKEVEAEFVSFISLMLEDPTVCDNNGPIRLLFPDSV